MVKGLYTAHTGMLNEQYRLDIITNNMANSATVGYKKESVSNQSFEDLLTLKINDKSEGNLDRAIGTMSLGVKIGEVYTDFTQGSLRQTDSNYDLAIEGNGFFQIAVRDSNGNETIKYTRDGCFKRTSEDYITDADGNHLMGNDGYVQVPTDASAVKIDQQGNVYCDSVLVNQIQLADFEDYDYLKKFGNNMYDLVDGGNVIETTATIHQGFTEQSNVQSVREMVDMISITRAYEANQKVISTVDSMLDKAVNSVGKV